MKDKNYNSGVLSGNWGLFQALLFVFLTFILSGLISLRVGDYLNGLQIDNTINNFILQLVASILSIGLVGVFLKIKKTSLRDVFGSIKLKYLYLILIYFIAYFVLIVSFHGLINFLPWYDPEQVQDIGFDRTGITGYKLALVFISLVILPPLVEELLFRRILYVGFRKKMPKILAAIFVSFLFGLAHMQWNVGFDTFVLSLVMIYGFEKEKSLWLPIGIHAFKNLVAFLMIFVF